MYGLVSIIMPSYNTADYIAATIRSVQAQTYTNWGLILVDDCSTDNTDEIVKPFLADKRIKYLKNDKNCGAAITRNRALREAKGKWIAFLDSDDLWGANKLEEQLKFMLDNHYDFTYTNYQEIDEQSHSLGRLITGPKHITKWGMYQFCWPGCLTVMYNANEIGLIQIPDIKKNNDYALWLKVIEHADCYLLEEDLAQYRRRKNSISRHNYLTLAKWHYKLFRQAQSRGMTASLILTLQNLVCGLYKKLFYVCSIPSKLCICGHLAAGKESANGQTVKTVMLLQVLRQQLGEGAIHTVDTCGGLRAWPGLLCDTAKAIKNFSNIIMLPAQRGLQVFAPLFIFYNFFFHRKLHYVVIGGWLPEMTKRKKWLAYFLKKFDGIYVETSSMKTALEEQGFTNVFVMPNFKDLPVLTEKELVYTTQEPFSFCTFSRVMKEKGIEDAMEAVTQLNTQTGRTVATLDIYGKIDDNYVERFEKLQQTFPSYICYKGVVAPDQSVNVLKNYFALLFPTYYAGEGFAGTLLDAMAAGIPVIASKWKYNSEIIMQNKTGRLIEASLLDEIKYATSHPQEFNALKPLCLEESQKYTPSKAIQILLKELQK